MKKLVMTFAIVAFLIGGFTISANAQNDDAKTSNKEKAKVENAAKDNASTVQKVDYDQMLKDYETYINKYIQNYKQSLKNNASSKAADWQTPLKKAQDLEKKLENAKKNLTDDQIAKFLKLKEKLASALTRK